MLCQNEKNRIPLTQRNLAVHQLRSDSVTQVQHSRTGLKGLRSLLTETQNIARQLLSETSAVWRMTYYKERQMDVL